MQIGCRIYRLLVDISQSATGVLDTGPTRLSQPWTRSETSARTWPRSLLPRKLLLPLPLLLPL